VYKLRKLYTQSKIKLKMIRYTKQPGNARYDRA